MLAISKLITTAIPPTNPTATTGLTPTRLPDRVSAPRAFFNARHGVVSIRMRSHGA
jgi:hypothetical protein